MVYQWREFKFFDQDIPQPEKVDELSIVGFLGQEIKYDLCLPSVSPERAHELSSKPGSLDFMAYTKLTVWCDSKLVKLPQVFAKLTQLKTVSIQRCTKLNFDIIFNWLTTLPKLKELYINDCKLKEVPATIGELTSLELLSFGSDDLITEANILETLPPEIGNLKQLKCLYLSGMYKTFKSLPVEIAKLANLEEISLSRCKWPVNLDLIPNLTELDLVDAYYSSDDLKALLTKRKTLRLLKLKEGCVDWSLQKAFPDLQFDIEPLPIDGFY